MKHIFLSLSDMTSSKLCELLCNVCYCW